MKLAFYYHIEIGLSSNNTISVPGFLGVFIDALAAELDTLYIVGHTTEVEEDYTLKSHNIVLVNLGIQRPAWFRHFFPKLLLGNLKNDLIDVDAILVRSPSPLAPFFSRFIPDTCQLCYYVVGSYESGANEMLTSSLREKVVKQFLYLNHRKFMSQLKGKDILVNAPALKKDYKTICNKIDVIPTTTISEADLFQREDTCISDKIRLLYTGRFDWQKGLNELMTVFASLHKEKENTELHFVGWEDDTSKPVEKVLRQKAIDFGVGDVVIFHGKKQVGEELSSMYRMADIYIMPSYHEGFPRTIWEALANSIPVVATNVGSIPEYMTHKENILMVNPKNINELKAAIELVMNDKELRQKIIHNGYKVASINTLKSRSKQIVEYVSEVL